MVPSVGWSRSITSPFAAMSALDSASCAVPTPVGSDVAVGVEALHPLGRGPLAGALEHEVAHLLRCLCVEAARGGGR